MILRVDPSLPAPLYRQITDQVIYRIAAGEVLGGEQLPSIRQLALELRINPNTVIKAYRELEHRGFAASRHGKGFFVSESGLSPARDEWRRRALEEIREAIRRARAVGLSLKEILKVVDQAAEGGAA